MNGYRTLRFLGFHYYRVGTDGSVWSRRAKGDTRGQLGPWWKMSARGTQYKMVTLFNRGVSKSYYVHQLVLLAFVGLCPEGMECRHLDGNPLNNRLKNLAWGTPDEQAADKHKHGTTSRGERHRKNLSRGTKHWASKLNEDKVASIRSEYASGVVTMLALATKHKVTISTISSVVHREIWTHIA